MTTDVATTLTATRSTWEFDPAHTSVEFKVKHMMITTVKGRFTGVQGKIIGDVENPTQAEVDVVIDAASVDTRNEQRDAHLRSADFLDVENFPHITFKSSRVDRVNDDEIKVSGDLTIRGVTRQVTLDVEIAGVGTSPFGTQVSGMSAKTAINRKDFGLNWNVALETGGWLVGEEVKIEIDIEAIKQSS
ncbi:MAG: YceI family protein [Chloroflexota bacterium]